MSWKEEIVQYAKSRGREVYDSELGLGIEFADRCDAFWILPNNTRSDIQLTGTNPAEIQDAIELFDRTDSMREQVLHILSHYWAQQFDSIERCRDGSWGCSCAGFSTSYDVGRDLTKVIIGCNSLDEFFKQWKKLGYGDGAKPGAKKIALWLEQALPMAVFQSEDASDKEEVETVAMAVPWFKKMKLVNDKRMIAILESLAQSLPAKKASVDLCNTSALSIEYHDGFDSLRVRFKSAKLKRRIEAEPPEAIATQFADQFLLTNALRTRALNAICAAAQKLGLKIDSSGVNSFHPGDNLFWFGNSTKQFSCPAGRQLSFVLTHDEPKVAFKNLFAASPEFAAECARQFDHTNEDQFKKFSTSALAPQAYLNEVALVDLDAAAVKRADEHADRFIEKLFTRKNILWDVYQCRYSYDKSIDTWCSESRWLKEAKRLAKGKRVPYSAIVMLLEAGDPLGMELAVKQIDKLEPHFEASEEALEIAWYLRHDYPELYEKWMSAEYVNDCFSETLAKLGDPIARRQEQMEYVPLDIVVTNFEELEERDWDSYIVQSMDASQQSSLREELTQWMGTEFRFGMSTPKFHVAASMGWPQVYDALESNPFLVSSLLSNEDCGASDFDEPALLMNSVIPLVWSCASPSVFLARLIATAFETDFVALARVAAKRAAAKRPAEKAGLPMAYRIYKKNNGVLMERLAIAWKRCRHLL